MNVDEAKRFIADNHNAVLITKKKDGGVQSSPITIGIDEEGKAVISSRETAYKVKNLRRDNWAVACVLNPRFYGDWCQIEGPVEIVELPEAMDGLIDYYRRISGEHPDWDDYRAAMERDKRVLVRVEIQKAGPTKGG